MSLRKVLLATTFLTVVSLVSAPVMASDVNEDISVLKQENVQLQKSLARLMSRLNRLEKRSKAAEKASKKTARAVTQAEDGSFELPGGTKIKIGGYAKLDVIHDMSGRSADTAATNGSDAAAFRTIPLDSDAAIGKRKHATRLHARQTRINLKTSTPTSWGDIGSFVEFDFFGTAGSAAINNPHTPRLRHAFATFNGFLAGQTWTTFQDVTVLANTLDFGGPVATSSVRQAQIRYTKDFQNGHKLFLAVEEAEADIIDSAGGTNSNSITRWPDLIAKWRYDGSKGHVAMAGLMRNLAYESGNLGSGSQGKNDKWGYGLSMTGKYKPFADAQGTYAKDNIYFRMVGGDGIGRYITEALNTGAAVNQATQTMDTQFAWGGYVGLQHYWMDTLRSSLVYGYARMNLKDYIAATNTERTDSIHANIIWSPIPSMDIGAEYIYGRREVKSGAKGYLNRVQGSVTYRF